MSREDPPSLNMNIYHSTYWKLGKKNKAKDEWIYFLFWIQVFILLADIRTLGSWAFRCSKNPLVLRPSASEWELNHWLPSSLDFWLKLPSSTGQPAFLAWTTCGDTSRPQSYQANTIMNSLSHCFVSFFVFFVCGGVILTNTKVMGKIRFKVNVLINAI